MKNCIDKLVHVLLKSYFGPLILLMLLLHLDEILISAGAVEYQSSNVTFPAMFVFGDSTVDPGNNNHILLTFGKSNFPPYGRDFVRKKATGRFSNGKLITDFVASKLGIKEILPAYFERGLNATDLLTGVSFGSAGSGLDNLTSQITLGISIWEQLEYLDKAMERLKVEIGREKVGQLMSEALFFVSSGSVDYLAYFNIPIQSFMFSVSEYTSYLVQSSSLIIKKLYQLGARKIGHVGVPPLGCVPLQRTLSWYLNRKCDDVVNSASALHNFKLMKETEKLQKELHGSKIIYLDAYSALLDVILNFKQYGFEDASLGCCGTGLIEGGVFCNPFIPSCRNASTHVFWDHTHPTERVCEMIANDVVRTVVAKFGRVS